MRAFVAVKISDAAREEVARLQEKLKMAGADVKWVEPENLHLTLKFLGETGEDRIGRLRQELQAVLQARASFTFTLEGLGAFPRPEQARVVWVGTGEGKERLIELAREVEEICSRSGFPAEQRPFSPHLTIGRVRSGKLLPELAQQIQALPFRASSPTPADRVVLFRSTLSPRGPVYTPLREILLSAS